MRECVGLLVLIAILLNNGIAKVIHEIYLNILSNCEIIAGKIQTRPVLQVNANCNMNDGFWDLFTFRSW